MKYIDGWTIVDDGYLTWLIVTPPTKLPTLCAEIRFIRWLESIRKVVECTFWIMKGKFRILKTRIPLDGVEVFSREWKTCHGLQIFIGKRKSWLTMGYKQESWKEGNHKEFNRSYYLVGHQTQHETSGIGFGSGNIYFQHENNYKVDLHQDGDNDN